MTELKFIKYSQAEVRPWTPRRRIKLEDNSLVVARFPLGLQYFSRGNGLPFSPK